MTVDGLRVIESRTSEGGMVGFRVDITELKKREQELKRSEDLPAKCRRRLL